MGEPVLAQLDPEGVSAMVGHLARNARESGRDGDAFARVRSADDPIDPAMGDRIRAGLATPTTAPGWERWWALQVEGEVRGHLDLRGAELASGLHRAEFGIGFERGWRRQGWGEVALRQAIDWATVAGLSWLDLGVMADNHPARALYRKLGFIEVGTVVDAFRVEGRSLDDVRMALALSRSAAD